MKQIVPGSQEPIDTIQRAEREREMREREREERETLTGLMEAVNKRRMEPEEVTQEFLPIG